MQGVRFLVNARLATLRADFLVGSRPQGYLVPPDYASKSVREQLGLLPAKHRRYLLVDNGRFDDLARLRNEAQDHARDVAACLKAAQVQTGEGPPRKALSVEARRVVDQFAAQIEGAAQASTGLGLAEQLEFKPHGVVGEEDILAALWYSLGLEPSFLLRGYARLVALNRRVATRTLQRRADGELGAVDDLPVVAAVDYRSAFDAGALYAQKRITHLCLPFGALMADDRCAHAYVGPKGLADMDSSVPVRVLRATLVARGLMDGWRSVHRTPPAHVHLLGLGQPLILALVASVFERVPLLTCDATSPFKDAAQGTLYTSVPVFRRLDVGAVAAKLLAQPAAQWDCPCAHCAGQLHRQDWAAAHALFASMSPAQRLPAKLKLGRQDALGRLLPMLTVNPDPEALAARIGHNHATLQTCVDALHRAKQREGGLARLARKWVAAYPVGTQANAFQRALDAALALL